MGMAKKIKYVLMERKITQTELARRLGTKISNINGKLSRDNFSEKELHEIAEALDCDFEGFFTLRDTGERF